MSRSRWQEIRPLVPVGGGLRKVKGKWIAIPVGFNGGYPNYRISAMQKAGFSKFPEDTAGFLELCRALKKNNTPAGFALGHATGDANTWCHWALWSHGANLVDANEKIVINSPETAKALEYVKAMYETFVPGTVSWNDSSNNKAFLAGDLYLTHNGISIYAAAKKDNRSSPRIWTTRSGRRPGRQAHRVPARLPDPGLQILEGAQCL